MIPHRLLGWSAALLLAAMSAAASADVLLLDRIMQQPPNSSSGLERPYTGMTMDQVRAKFGEPKLETGAVGDPPISRWTYDAFTVYFEYDKTITSVLH